MAAGVSKRPLLCQADDTSLDLKGDIGAVGRIKIDKKSGTPLQLDLKGIEYSGQIFRSPTLFVVTTGVKSSGEEKQDVAKIEFAVNEVVQLTRTGDVFGTEQTLLGSTADYNINDADDGGYKKFRAEDSDDEGV